MIQKLHFVANHNNKLYNDAFIHVCPKKKSNYVKGDILELHYSDKVISHVEVVKSHNFLLKDVTDTISLLDSGIEKDRFLKIWRTRLCTLNNRYNWKEELMTMYTLKVVKALWFAEPRDMMRKTFVIDRVKAN